VQIHGETGLLRGVGVERAYRDARISEIFEGTNEINRIVVASDILRRAGVRISP
jgi:butyryl-CoA dehydrogenase